MGLSDDEFRSKLNLLGLGTDETPASQEDVQSIPDPEQADAPEEMVNPGVGFEGNPGQEKSPLVAGPEMAPPMPKEANASFQPSAQVASAMEDAVPAAEAPAPAKQSPVQQKAAQETISSVIQNPTVNEYIRTKYGENADLNDVAMKEAQESANNRRLAAGIGAGFETIARAPSTIKPDTDFYNNLSKNADSGVKDIKDRQKAKTDKLKGDLDKLKLQEQSEDNDPNSPAAAQLRKAYGKAFKAFGLDEDTMANASPRMLNTYYEKMLSSANAAEMRKNIAEINAEARRQANEDRKDKKVADKLVKFSEALDPNKARGGQLALSQQRYNQAENLQGLVNKSAAGMNLDQRETEDFALGLAKMLSGSGASSRAQVEALVPKTMHGDYKKITEWLTNDPKGLEQQQFVKRMYSTVQREKQIANQQIKDGQMQRIAGFEADPDLSKDQLQDVMYSYGIAPEAYDSFKTARRSGKAPGVDFNKIVGQDEKSKAPATQPNTPPKAPSMPPSGATVTIKRKSDGAMKTLSADSAAKYLNSPDFEQVK